MSNISRVLVYNGKASYITISSNINKYFLVYIISKVIKLPFLYLYNNADELFESFKDCFEYTDDSICIQIEECSSTLCKDYNNTEINIEVMFFNSKTYFFSSYKNAEQRAINSLVMSASINKLLESRVYKDNKLIELKSLPVHYYNITTLKEITDILEQKL